jgi:hypothetical protein
MEFLLVVPDVAADSRDAAASWCCDPGGDLGGDIRAWKV